MDSDDREIAEWREKYRRENDDWDIADWPEKYRRENERRNKNWRRFWLTIGLLLAGIIVIATMTIVLRPKEPEHEFTTVGVPGLLQP